MNYLFGYIYYWPIAICITLGLGLWAWRLGKNPILWMVPYVQVYNVLKFIGWSPILLLFLFLPPVRILSTDVLFLAIVLAIIPSMAGKRGIHHNILAGTVPFLYFPITGAFPGFFARRDEPRTAKNYALAITALCSFLLAYTFFPRPFQIPSTSMEATLYRGDQILMKSSYGFRLPFSNKKFFPMGEIEHGDIIVFKTDWNGEQPKFFVKRAIGLAGDSFELKEGKVLLNGTEQAGFPYQQATFKLEADHPLPTSYFAQHSINPIITETTTGRIQLHDSKENYADWRAEQDSTQPVNYYLTLSSGLAARISEELKPLPLTPAQSIDIYAYSGTGIFPNQPKIYQHDLYNMGPFIVPKKGLTIPMNRRTGFLYESTIEKYEGGKVEILANSVLLDGKLIEEYTFQKDYIFCLGDNRDNSKDSRMSGFISTEEVYGEVWMVAYSRNPYNNSFRWNRLLKLVR